jgi:hypothetical protein
VYFDFQFCVIMLVKQTVIRESSSTGYYDAFLIVKFRKWPMFKLLFNFFFFRKNIQVNNPTTVCN